MRNQKLYIKKNQSKLKNTITGTKNILQGVASQMTQESISDLKIRN